MFFFFKCPYEIMEIIALKNPCQEYQPFPLCYLSGIQPDLHLAV